MDGSSQLRDRDRSRVAAHYPRAPSRSSTSTTSTKVASQTTNTSSTRLVSSPPPRPSTVVHPAHRHYHTRCKTPTTPRPQSTNPIGTSVDSASQNTVSSFLQEKLQKRREEAEKNAATRLAQDVNSTIDQQSRTAQSSPTKSSSADGRRPQSSGGSERNERNEPTKKKGMGVKEMEATVSTLHKQNFDLKLELYHRRERQNSLENRVDALESSKRQTEDVNDQLLEELEKRDKAVQEAVQMIVLLEARVEQLVEEREMVRQVEATGYSRFGAGGGNAGNAPRSTPLDAPAPKTKMADLAKLEDDAKVINRMPSFLSEKTESTANLRRVYLGTQGSLLSLPKLADGPPIPEHGHGRTTSMALRSPSLSELSESSFASVYGDKDGGHERPEREQWSNGQQFSQSQGGEYGTRQRSASGTVGRGQRSSSIHRPGANFLSIESVVERGPTLRRAERSYSSHGEAPGSSVTARSSRNLTQPQPQPQPQLNKTRDEKRDALRRVTTDGNGRPHFDQNLPPTPDTISTSTLRRLKNSNDTLVQQPGAATGSYVEEKDKPEPPAEHTGGVSVSQRSAVTPAPGSSQQIDFAGDGYWNNRDPLPPRPRSADETTVSHKKGANAGGAGAWKDSDDEDFNDNASVHSLESSLDIWLQQGKEPKRRSTAGGGRASPDLFAFPSRGGTGAWEPSAMYGQRQRHGAPRVSEGASLHWPDPLQDLLPIQRELFGGTGVPPPPPNRRSSLHARVVSSSAGGPVNTTGTPTAAQNQHQEHTNAAAGSGSAATTPQRQAPEQPAGRFRKAFSRAARRNSEGGSTRRLSLTSTSNNQQHQHQQGQGHIQGQPGQQGEAGKQTQGNRSPYPPLTRPESTTPRNHRRINSLWRRSLGGGTNPGSAASSPVAPKDASAATNANANASEQSTADFQLDGGAVAGGVSVKGTTGTGGSIVGTPSWVHRARAAEMDDKTRGLGATPPPIMRQPQLRQKTSGGAASGSSGGAGAGGAGGVYLDSEGAPLGDGYDYADEFGYGHGHGHEYESGKEPARPTTPATPTMAAAGDAAAQGGGVSLGNGGGGHATSGTGAGAGAGGAAGGRRKWLPGFGKGSSLRNRTG